MTHQTSQAVGSCFMEAAILQTLDRDGAIADTGNWASSSGYDHNAVVGSVKSLHSYEMITSEVSPCL